MRISITAVEAETNVMCEVLPMRNVSRAQRPLT